jgi:addiction module HigA family antidote
MRLTQLNAATTINDLRFPPSNRLEALKHDRKGQWSIRINDQWRICFRYERGDAFDVEITDYHWGKSDMTIRNGLSPIHPGEFLKEGLDELGTSQSEFARVIGVSSMRISHIVNGARPVTAELALLIGRALGQSPQYWLNLQAGYDLKIAEQGMRSRLRAMRPLAHAWT